MESIADKHLEQIPRIKKNVEEWMNFFSRNNNDFRRSKTLVYKSSMPESDKDALAAQNIDSVEANIGEPYISRLYGEFSKQVPEMSVRAINDFVPYEQVNLVESINRAILNGKSYEKFAKRIYKDTLSGGFSVGKVTTKYESPRSFKQIIFLENVFDPTLCGFDPLAREPSKSDGEYCFELYPKSRDELKAEYPHIDFAKFKSAPLASNAKFRWSYKSNGKDVLYLSDYYEKKYKTITLYEVQADLLNPDNLITMTKEDYEKTFLENPHPLLPPPPITDERKEKVSTIWRYKFVSDKLLEKPEETMYAQLPLVFFDGNSEWIDNEQITRCYLYNAFDLIRVKNIAFSKALTDMLNARATDVIIPEAGLPDNPMYQQAYIEPSKAKSALIYNHIDENNNPIPPPTILPRNSINEGTMAMFQSTTGEVQHVLGSFDAQQGIQQSELSGIAIVEGATQSNSAAMPYVDNFLVSLNQIAKINTDLIPKLYKTFRTVPIIDKDGNHSYKKVNDPNNKNSMLDYEGSDLEVTINSAANFEIQKNRALQILDSLSKTFPNFNKFIDTEGLTILMDNVDIRGQSEVRQKLQSFLDQEKQKAAQMPNPVIVQMQNDAKALQIKEKEVNIKAAQAQNDIMISQQKTFQEALRLKEELMQSKTQLLLHLRDQQNEADRTKMTLYLGELDAQLKIADHFLKIYQANDKQLSKEAA